MTRREVFTNGKTSQLVAMTTTERRAALAGNMVLLIMLWGRQLLLQGIRCLYAPVKMFNNSSLKCQMHTSNGSGVGKLSEIVLFSLC